MNHDGDLMVVTDENGGVVFWIERDGSLHGDLDDAIQRLQESDGVYELSLLLLHVLKRLETLESRGERRDD